MKIKISDVVSIIVLSILIVACLIAYLPLITGLNAFYVDSESMRPTLKEGHLVFVKETSFEEIQVNDIITFSNDTQTKFCTHRVVSKDDNEKSFETKGDNNNSSDPLDTYYEYVKGKVVFSIPFVGKIFTLLNTKTAKVIVVMSAIIYLAIEIEFFKRKKKGRA